MLTEELKKRKICFVITSFIHYSRNLLVLEELKKRDDVELHIALGGSVILSRYYSQYANVEKALIEKGFKNIYKIYFNVDGTEPVSKAKTAGLAVVEFASLFNQIKPDLVVVRGDRFEVLGAATAASFSNIPIAHLEGGDITGSIDESVRHAITKLSQIHFATNEESKKRIIQMGEASDYVFDFGSPDIEVADKFSKQGDANSFQLNIMGSGFNMEELNGFLMVMFHPVATEADRAGEQAKVLLSVIYSLNMPVVWFWPNFDAGAEEISHQIRSFRDKTENHKIKFMRYLLPEQFIWLLNKAKCLVGNSSSAIKECSWLGIPAVNVGTRQEGRMKAGNVLNTSFNEEEIKNAILKQVEVGRYDKSDMYFGEESSQKTAEKLATINLYLQKKFNT